MEKCRVCEVSHHFPHPTGVCQECRDKLGITVMPPPQRRAMPCRCCNGMKFVRAIPREYTETQYAGPNTAQMAATYEPKKQSRTSRIFTSKAGYDVTQADLIADKAYGLLELYICTACGLVEWFCREPAEIPIGPEYMTELVDHGGDGPYR
jgi:hypothetical protein